MSQIPDQRLDQLRDVNQRLGMYEKEPQGISIVNAVNTAKEHFPPESYSIDQLFDIIDQSAQLEDQDSDAEGFKHSLTMGLRASLAIITYSNDILPPYLFLWGKYLNNAARFCTLALLDGVANGEMYQAELIASKRLALKAGWSDFEGLRMVYDYVHQGGWFYDADDVIFPKPVGANDLHLYQLVLEHSLLSFPRNFNLRELLQGLGSEIIELKQELVSSERDPYKIAFEATDIFIYLTHIATVQGLSISELINDTE